MIYSIEELNEKYKGKLARLRGNILLTSEKLLDKGEVVLILEFESASFQKIFITLLSRNQIVKDYFFSNLEDYIVEIYELI